MKRVILLVLILILIPAAQGSPAQYPCVFISSSMGTAVNLYAEPGQRSIIYQNATIHIFAAKNTTYHIYVNDELTENGTTESTHTVIHLHLLRNTHSVRVVLRNETFSFTVLVTNQAITQGGIHQIEQMMTIPPWMWTQEQWYVFADTIFGAIMAVPLAIVLARYLILRKWGGANVIS